jgi:aspartyl protease family protein
MKTNGERTRRRLGQLAATILGAVLAAGPAVAVEIISIDNTGPQATKLIILLVVFVAILFTMRGLRLPHVLRSFLIWGALLLALVALYAFRGPLEDAGRQVASVLIPGVTYVDAERVVVHRSFGGHFQLDGMVDGAPVRFLFDTGASSVVLSAEDAARAGLDPASLDYRLPVMTASGMTTVAPVRLEEVGVGNITLSGVRAAVARPGDLDQSLLGLTFLNRIEGYEVRRDRLVLHP